MVTPSLFVGDDAPPPGAQKDVRPDKDDDEISLNSSLASQHDSDEEWAVEYIRYQTTQDGKDYYLVEWTGYPIEEATWEPEENILGELMVEWRATQQRQARGEEDIFDVVAWQRRVEKLQKSRHEAAMERHRQRNIQRKRRGLPVTLWQGECKEDYYGSDEDVGQDDFNDIFPSPKAVAQQDHAASSKQQESKQPILQKPARPNKRASSKEMSKSPAKQTSSTAVPHKRPRQAPAVSTLTGYQGTARKPSTVKPPRGIAADRLSPTTPPAQSSRAAQKPQAGTRKMIKTSNNVFAGGKPIRQHHRLSENIVDTTKDPRLFSNHRIRRKAELQSRDKGDQAPASIPTTLFSISNGPPATSGSGSGSGSSAAMAIPRSAMKRSADDSTMRSNREPDLSTSDRTDSTTPTIAGHQVPQSRPALKKKKSVQWADDIVLVEEPESMDVDNPTSDHVTNPKSPSRRLKSPPLDVSEFQQPRPESRQPQPESQQPQPEPPQLQPSRKLSIAEYQKRDFGQNIDKSIRMGPAATKYIQMTFENVRHDSGIWRSRFVDQESLDFSASCTARTFSQRKDAVVEQVLGHGSLVAKSPSDERAVDSAAKRLGLGSFGAACFRDDFTIIIYPAACESWKGAIGITETEAASPANVALKYFVYKPTSIAVKPLPAVKNSPIESGKMRASIFQNLIGLDYHKLTPPGLRDVRHNFYLAFPPSREAMLDAVSEWLHTQNPSCRVFSTKTSGDWTAFTNPKIVGFGTVIVHEAATDVIRSFPGLLKMLLHKNSATYLFWCLSESLQRYPLYPSVRSVHHTTKPGKLGLTRLFPHGSAVLVTPSFLLAEPRRARHFFNWYSKTRCKPVNNIKVVAASGLCKFLEDIALEKAEQREDLLSRADDTQHSKSAQESLALKAKLIQEDCAARFDTWAIVDGLRRSFLDNVVPDEQLEPIVFADDCIDANDEQSLVNWFGYWSHTRFDQFRKFLVLGTDNSSEAQHVITFDNLPVYSPGTEHDMASERRIEPERETAGQVPGPNDEVLPSGSRLVCGSSFWALRGHLGPMSKRIPSPFVNGSNEVVYIAKLYNSPVSHWDHSTAAAEGSGNNHHNYRTYEDWFQHQWPFYSRLHPPFIQVSEQIPVKGPPLFNLYLAFFYTPQGWVPSEKRYRGRHPWIAAYRTGNQGIKPWKSTELIIWDVSTKNNFSPESEILASRLNIAQQELIRHVLKNGPSKNPYLPLEKVWLGGFGQSSSLDSFPLDITLETLGAMSREAMTYLPPADASMLHAGYRPVQVDISAEEKQAGPRLNFSDAMAIDVPAGLFGDEDDPNNKVIFYPPRGPKSLVGPSRCENLLYKWSRDEARRDTSRSAFLYTFKPTVEWYRTQQMAENRNFEHIHVGSWPSIFEALRIPERKEDREESRK